MGNMTFKASLLPSADNTYSLGSNESGKERRWKIYGSLYGNADSATKWATARTLTIGGTEKEVDGTANVAWGKAEILGESNTTKFYRGDQSWSNEISGGLFKITNNGNTLSIGNQAPGFMHFINSADIPFYFNNDIFLNGDLIPIGISSNTRNLGRSINRWQKLYIGTADTYGSNTQPIWWKDGTPTAITYTANRLYYPSTTTAFTAGTHYVSNTKIAINSTSIPNETLYVNGNTKINGTLHITPPSGPHTDGIRIYPSSAGWTTIALCGTDNTNDSGTSAATWSLHTKDGNFYLSQNGSSSATVRFTGHNGNGFSIRPRLSINTDVNTGYNLYVNGTSYHNGNNTHAGNINPEADNTRNLGASSTRWANAYITTTHGDLDGKLSSTPNNTTTFLRGDNTWNNTLNDYYIAASDTNVVGFTAVRGNNQINLYSAADGSGVWVNQRGSTNAFTPLFVDANGTANFYGRIYRFQDTGIIYSDLLNTTYSGLVLSGGSNYGLGATMILRNADANNDHPGGFFVCTANTSGINHQLTGQNNGLLTWDGGFSVTTGANPGCGTATGHTISTNGNIGCNYEMYAGGGFFAGSTNPTVYCWNGSNWSNIIGTWNNNNSYINAAGDPGDPSAGGRLYVGWNNTNDILFGPSTTAAPGYKFGIWQYGATMVSRAAGYGTDNGGPALAIREVNEVGNQSDKADMNYSPRIAFHWSGRECVHIGLESDGIFRFRQHNSGNLHTIQAGAVWGAVWNDYAEMRNVPEVQKLMKEKKPIENYETIKRDIPMAGYVVHEVGDDTMELVNERLLRGCRVISDTFGFNIGETKNAKTPIAVSGRVLVYCYEGREEAHKHIGYGVCSGPNGTVSIMTEEEERMYPMSIIGTISAVPDYEEWGEEHIKVNGRIWIYVK